MKNLFNHKKLGFLVFLISFFAMPQLVYANDVKLDIDSINYNETDGFLEFYLQYQLGEEIGQSQHLKTVSLKEWKDSLRTWTYVLPRVEEEVKYDTLKTEGTHIFILSEQGLQIDAEEQATIQALIGQLQGQIKKSNAAFYFAQFSDQFTPFVEQSQLAFTTVPKVSEEAEPALYHTLIEQIRHIRDNEQYPGKKIIMLFCSGANQSPFTEESASLPFDSTDLELFLEGLPKDILIFPIGIGSDENQATLLETITNSTPNSNDDFAVGKIPVFLSKAIDTDISVRYTHILKFSPQGTQIYKGETWNYELQLDKYRQRYSTQPGSVYQPKVITRNPKSTEWLILGGIGFGIIALILLICFKLFPLLQKVQFKNKYVKPYVPKKGRKVIDPITGEALAPGELVVTKCHQTVALDTWNMDGHCPFYPDCMGEHYFGCDGAGAPEKGASLFSMNGIYRNLNWLWFGAVGGYLGWIFYGLISSFFQENLKAFMQSILQSINPMNFQSGYTSIEFVRDLTNNTLIGIALGTSLILMLSMVEERSQARANAMVRTIGRTVLGLLVCAIVFSLGFYIEKAIEWPYLGGLFTWLLFGLALGLVLSVKSSINLYRGFIGGGLAAFIGYQFYWLIGMYFADFYLSKLIGMIIFGAILGLVLATVIAYMEDFKLEYVQPTSIQNPDVPISKWLKSGVEVLIGTGTDCYVYIKWKDEAVLEHHAKLTYEEGNVFLTAIGETIVNNQPIQKGDRMILRDGAMIQLGRDSITKMCFKAKFVEQSTSPKATGKLQFQKTH